MTTKGKKGKGVMCRKNIQAAIILLATLNFGASQQLLAHTCPSGATDTGVGGAVGIFRASTGNSVPGGGFIGICEPIFLRGAISYNPIGPSGNPNAAFEGGTVIIKSISGTMSFAADVTPIGGVPLIGPPECGPNSFVLTRNTPNYVPAEHPGDIVNGQIT